MEVSGLERDKLAVARQAKLPRALAVDQREPATRVSRSSAHECLERHVTCQRRGAIDTPDVVSFQRPLMAAGVEANTGHGTHWLAKTL